MRACGRGTSTKWNGWVGRPNPIKSRDFPYAPRHTEHYTDYLYSDQRSERTVAIAVSSVIDNPLERRYRLNHPVATFRPRMPSNQGGTDPASTIWAGLIDGSAAPRPSRFYRPRPDPDIGLGTTESSRETANATFVALSGPDRPSLRTEDKQGSAVGGPAKVVQSSPDGTPWPTDDLIPTQPDSSAQPIQLKASSILSVNRHDPDVIQMDIKHAGLEAHQVTILPTDSAATCNRKAERVGDLLDTGHTLAAHLDLFQGVPSQHTPDSLAIEAMAPEEKRAWCWWAQHEATEVGSAARQMPPLNIDTDRAAVPPTAPGNKSSVAQKTPALELLYGLSPGTLSAEHVAFFLRPSNAASVVSGENSLVTVSVCEGNA